MRLLALTLMFFVFGLVGCSQKDVAVASDAADGSVLFDAHVNLDAGTLQDAVGDGSNGDAGGMDAAVLVDDDAGAVCDAGANCETSDCSVGTWDHDGDPSSACVAWHDCEVGEYVGVHGSSNTDRECAPCPDGTESTGPNAGVCVLPVDATFSLRGSHFVGPRGAVPIEGTGTTCAIRAADGQPLCWGNNLNGEASPPLATPMAAIDGTCGIRTNGHQLACWGQLFGAPEGEELSALGTSNFGGCGIRRVDRRTVCWPQVLATGAPQYPGDLVFSRLDGGFRNFCAITEADGRLHCWRGDGASTWAPPQGRFSAVSVGNQHACAIRADDFGLECWGDDTHGQVSQAPMNVAVRAVAAGRTHTCAIRRDDGNVLCWGDDTYGAISSAPTGMAMRSIQAGGDHTCAKREADDTLLCWGANDSGQISGAPNTF